MHISTISCSCFALVSAGLSRTIKISEETRGKKGNIEEREKERRRKKQNTVEEIEMRERNIVYEKNYVANIRIDLGPTASTCRLNYE